MTAVLAWGKVDCEALGFGNSDSNGVTVPRQVHSPGNTKVRSVSCGEKHTLICLEDGSIQSCGANDFKQCGRSTAELKLGPVKSLRVQGVLQVATGSSHNVVLADTNKVYTWGRNDKGQLGRGDVHKKNQGIPKLVKSLAAYSVIQISCGNNHTLALTDVSLVFAWGSNEYGQLGLGKIKDSKNQPEQILNLTGIPVLKVAAGGNHSFVLSLSGIIYGWGRNNCGQLGLNNTEDYSSPEQCRLLRDQCIQYICSGNNHTACLTKDGHVFTFGKGKFGQLGHGNNNMETTPKQIMTFADFEVSQIACGRNHTLAYVPKSDTVYAFGKGKSGQLGISSVENKNSPVSVGTETCFLINGFHSFMQEDSQNPQLTVKSIYAGWDQSFLIVTDQGSDISNDFRKCDPARQILTISQERCKKPETPSSEFFNEIGKMFSNLSCLNASFLLPNKAPYDNRKNSAIDIKTVQAFFQDIRKHPDLMQMISTKIEQDLISKLPNLCQVTEARAVYLILPASHIFDQPEKYDSIHCPFARSFLSLKKEAKKYFCLWWSSNEEFFTRLIMIYKQTVQYLLRLPSVVHVSKTKTQECYVQCLEMLKVLHQANEVHRITSYTTFYVPEIKDPIDTNKYILNLVQNYQSGMPVQEFHFNSYPFVLDGEAKNLLLQANFGFQQQVVVYQEFPFDWSFIPWFMRELFLSVSRQSLINDAFEQIKTTPPKSLKKHLTVGFKEEAGGLGVTKEFFLLLFQEVMNPEYNMFTTDEVSNLVWFNSLTGKELDLFRAVGIICGLMIYNSIIVDLHLPLAFYKKLLKKPVTLDDVKELQPTVGRSLQAILDFDGDEFEDVYNLTFVFGSTDSRELIPGGASRVVTQENKKVYVNLCVDFIFNKSVETLFEAFSDGVYTVCTRNVLNSFHPEELRALVEGNEKYDFNEFEKNTQYKGEYRRKHPTINFFWEVFFEMDLQEKKKFLLFLRSSDRIPITGMKSIEMTIQPSVHEGEEFLPCSQTCLSLLHLPKYKSKEQLRSKLLAAIKTEVTSLDEVERLAENRKTWQTAKQALCDTLTAREGSWGKASLGALGLSNKEQYGVTTPCQIKSLDSTAIENLSTGHNHTLICLRDGSVYSCGANDFGQCGQEGILAHLGCVQSLSIHHVIQVAVGSSHSVVLTEAHEVLTWGRNDSGQLGRDGTHPENQRVPKLVKSLAVHCVIQVSCGCDHTITLTNEGLVFVWGSNSYGQLGLGKGTDSNQSQPELISCLKGIPVLQVIAGGNHSFILSKSGAVYGWGRNSFGQLGLNDMQDYNVPQQCRPIRSQRIKYIACGENHTACLTKDGRVFTFGEGIYGQLGHSGNNSEILPRQVMELSGSEVTQIACGRGHTLAYVPKSGKLYAFGLGESGQLGLSNTENKNSPFSIQGPFISGSRPRSRHSSMQVDNQGPELRIRRIFAGGDQSFVVAEDASICESDDFRTEDPMRQILILSHSKIEPLRSLSAMDKPASEISNDLEKIFSNASCLNGSFLLPNEEHYGSSSKKHGVDMNAVRTFFQDMAKISNIIVMQFISTNIEQYLLPALSPSPADVEALRLYLMLPESHLFDEIKHHSSIICPFARNLLSLNTNALKVFDSWWPSNQPSFFNRLVVIYKQCLEYLLQLPETRNSEEIRKRQADLFTSMNMLQKLSKVNDANNQIIPYHKFHVSKLNDKVNIREDYICWIHGKNLGSKVGGITVPGLYFSNYPFVLDGIAKSMLLQTDAALQMQQAVNDVQRQNILGFFTRLTLPPTVSPCLILHVSRSNLVQDTLRQLQKQNSSALKRPLKVIFQGEEAIDEGGVRKEFFMLLLREIMDPKYDMFKTHDVSNLQWFSPTTFEEPHMFCMIGILCGLAIYNFTIIDLHFPLALYKKLLKKAVTLDDLKELMPEVGKSLQDLIDYDGDDLEETFNLTFEVLQDRYGETKSVELVSGGASKMVNQNNKQEYINLYVDFVLNKSVEVQFSAFNCGFQIVCGGRVMEMFHPQELQAMVIGNEDYDFSEFEKNTEYKRDYYRQHPTVSLFWEVFYEISLEDKKKFLLFLTGSNRIPVFGMKYVKMIIQPSDMGEDHLPVAHTCFNVLDLPRYSTKERLKSKLLLAIQQTEGFGLA